MMSAVCLTAYFVYDHWNRTKDSDGDGIKDIDEINKYHTDPDSRDSDSDGISDYDEIFVYNIDPVKPNLNVKQALDLGLKDCIGIVRPLDNDGVQDGNERGFVKLMADSKKVLVVPTFLNYLSEKASDGRIADDELKCLNVFSHLVKGLYDVVFEKKFA